MNFAQLLSRGRIPQVQPNDPSGITLLSGDTDPTTIAPAPPMAAPMQQMQPQAAPQGAGGGMLGSLGGLLRIPGDLVGAVTSRLEEIPAEFHERQAALEAQRAALEAFAQDLPNDHLRRAFRADPVGFLTNYMQSVGTHDVAPGHLQTGPNGDVYVPDISVSDGLVVDRGRGPIGAYGKAIPGSDGADPWVFTPRLSPVGRIPQAGDPPNRPNPDAPPGEFNPSGNNSGAVQRPSTGFRFQPPAGPAPGTIPQAGDNNPPGPPAPPDMDAVIRTVYAEGDPNPAGWQAVAGVIANRARASGRSPAEIVAQPHQFEGYGSRRFRTLQPGSPAYQAVADAVAPVLSGQTDPTGGADSFYSPGLQAKLGRPAPSWDDGSGQMIGTQRFLSGKYGGFRAPAARAPIPQVGGGQSDGPTLTNASTIETPGGTLTQLSPGNPRPRWRQINATQQQNTVTGEIKSVPPGPLTDGSGSGLTGDDFLRTLPAGRANIVRSIANGDAAMPAGNMLRTPYGQQLLQDVLSYDPTASAANLASRTATRRDFTSGRSAKTVTALNQVIGHLGSLDQSVDALHNTDLNWINGPAQWAGQTFGNRDTQAAVAAFNAYKTAVANELTTVFRGTGGAEADIQNWMKQLDSAQSPTGLHTTVRAMVDELQARIDSLGDSYSRGMGRSEDPMTLLSPQASQIYSRLRGDDSRQTAGPPAGAVSLLRQRPDLAAQFDQKYGPGAARRALGQ